MPNNSLFETITASVEDNVSKYQDKLNQLLLDDDCQAKLLEEIGFELTWLHFLIITNPAQFIDLVEAKQLILDEQLLSNVNNG